VYCRGTGCDISADGHAVERPRDARSTSGWARFSSQQGIGEGEIAQRNRSSLGAVTGWASNLVIYSVRQFSSNNKQFKPVSRLVSELRELLDGDGFGEVAGLVDVAAATDGDVIGEEL
jgi:hypothetical protein